MSHALASCQRADYGRPSAEQIGSAQNCRGDGGKLIAVAGRWIAGVGSCDEQQPGNSGQQPGQRIERNAMALHAHPHGARGRLAVADHQGISAEARMDQYEVHDDPGDQKNDYGRGYPERPALTSLAVSCQAYRLAAQPTDYSRISAATKLWR